MQVLGILLVVAGAGLMILARERHISVAALAVHYVGMIFLLAQSVTPEIAVVELAVAVTSTALVWLASAERPLSSDRTHEEPMSAVFQALTLVLCVVAAISLASTYQITSDPEHSNLNLAFFWLATLGLLALGITRRPLSIGGGLLFLLEAVQIAYLARASAAETGIIFGLASVQLILVLGVTRAFTKSVSTGSSARKGGGGGAGATVGTSKRGEAGRAVEIIVAMFSVALLVIAALTWDVFLTALILTGIGLLAAFLLEDSRTGHNISANGAVSPPAMKALALVTFAGLCLQVAVILAAEFEVIREPLLGRIIVGLTAMGLMAFFGAFPFHSWLLELARRASPLTAIVVVGSLSLGALTFFAQLLGSYPWLLSDERSQMALITIGVLGYALSALIAVSRRDFLSLIVYAAAGNAGVLLAGLGSDTYQGFVGAAILTLNQCVALLLLLMCVGLARGNDRPGGDLDGDFGIEGIAAAARERPFLALGIALGSLTIVGVPPFAGFLGRWVVFMEVSRLSTHLAVLVVAASLVSIFSFVPVFRGLLSALDLASGGKRETAPLRVVLLSLALLPLAVGLYPPPILAAVGEILRGIQVG